MKVQFEKNGIHLILSEKELSLVISTFYSRSESESKTGMDATKFHEKLCEKVSEARVKKAQGKTDYPTLVDDPEGRN